MKLQTYICTFVALVKYFWIFEIKYLILEGLDLKSLKKCFKTVTHNFSTTVTQNCSTNVTQNCFTTVTQNCSTTVTQNCSTKVTLNMVHNYYSKHWSKIILQDSLYYSHYFIIIILLGSKKTSPRLLILKYTYDLTFSRTSDYSLNWQDTSLFWTDLLNPFRHIFINLSKICTDMCSSKCW